MIGTTTKTFTKGNIIIENLKCGDVIYEFGYNMCIKSTITKEPTLVDGIWYFDSLIEGKNETINYAQSTEYPHYGLNIYDCMAYTVSKIIE